MFLTPKGRNWGNVVNWDDLGKLYAGFIISWTIILLSGVAWLFRNRRLPFIRIRNLPLALSSTFFLHIYLVKICLAYTTNGHFLCSAEFWIMSIYLPLGIALYQAYLAQLRSLWEEQQKLVLSFNDRRHDKSIRGFVRRWQCLSSLKQSYCIIALGFIVQLIVTAVLYATSPTLQGDWSSFGNVSHAKGQKLCRQIPQWIPSAFWQLFLAWIYGPYTLFRTRNIHDIHFWKAQVAISVIASLPGTPLWLASVYRPEFSLVNRRWVPPMWLAPGILVIQFVTIFFPIFEYFRRKREMNDTMALLRAWDEQSEVTERDSMGKSPKVSISGLPRQPPNPDTRINTLDSLRKAISVNPTPLLQFAATRDFTAENILFLVRVRQWRSAWSTAPKIENDMSPAALTNLFNMAVDIYSSLIDERVAEFPINISHRIREKLERIFSPATPRLSSESKNSQKPVGLPETDTTGRMEAVRFDSDDSGTTLWDKHATLLKLEPIFSSHPGVRPLGGAKGVVREGFAMGVFDEAEKEIEYLVLTNTWQKFVKMESTDEKTREARQSLDNKRFSA